MTLTEIAESLPAYARDLKLNLQNVLAQQELTGQQTWTTAVACALACRNQALSGAILAEAAGKLTPQQLESAKAAFAIMEMNNIYYRFRHMLGKDEYANIPARLRMQAIRMHGGDPVDFELACLAASSTTNSVSAASALGAVAFSSCSSSSSASLIAVSRRTASWVPMGISRSFFKAYKVIRLRRM